MLWYVFEYFESKINGIKSIHSEENSYFVSVPVRGDKGTFCELWGSRAIMKPWIKGCNRNNCGNCRWWCHPVVFTLLQNSDLVSPLFLTLYLQQLCLSTTDSIAYFGYCELLCPYNLSRCINNNRISYTKHDSFLCIIIFTLLNNLVFDIVAWPIRYSRAQQSWWRAVNKRTLLERSAKHWGAHWGNTACVGFQIIWYHTNDIICEYQ